MVHMVTGENSDIMDQAFDRLEQVDDLINENKLLNEKLKLREDEYNRLKDELGKLAGDLNVCILLNEELQRQNEELQRQNEELKAKMRELELEVERMDEATATSEFNLNALERKLSFSQSLAEDLNEKIAAESKLKVMMGVQTDAKKSSSARSLRSQRSTKSQTSGINRSRSARSQTSMKPAGSIKSVQTEVPSTYTSSVQSEMPSAYGSSVQTEMPGAYASAVQTEMPGAYESSAQTAMPSAYASSSQTAMPGGSIKSAQTEMPGDAVKSVQTEILKSDAGTKFSFDRTSLESVDNRSKMEGDMVDRSVSTGPGSFDYANEDEGRMSYPSDKDMMANELERLNTVENELTEAEMRMQEMASEIEELQACLRKQDAEAIHMVKIIEQQQFDIGRLQMIENKVQDICKQRDILRKKLEEQLNCVVKTHKDNEELHLLKRKHSHLSHEVSHLKAIEAQKKELESQMNMLLYKMHDYQDAKEMEICRLNSKILKQNECINVLQKILMRMEERSSNPCDQKGTQTSDLVLKAKNPWNVIDLDGGEDDDDDCCKDLATLRFQMKDLQKKVMQQGALILSQRKCLLEQHKYILEQEQLRNKIQKHIRDYSRKQDKLAYERNVLRSEVMFLTARLKTYLGKIRILEESIQQFFHMDRDGRYGHGNAPDTRAMGRIARKRSGSNLGRRKKRRIWRTPDDTTINDMTSSLFETPTTSAMHSYPTVSKDTCCSSESLDSPPMTDYRSLMRRRIANMPMDHYDRCVDGDACPLQPHHTDTDYQAESLSSDQYPADNQCDGCSPKVTKMNAADYHYDVPTRQGGFGASRYKKAAYRRDFGQSPYGRSAEPSGVPSSDTDEQYMARKREKQSKESKSYREDVG